jgi:hypothetical protein
MKRDSDGPKVSAVGMAFTLGWAAPTLDRGKFQTPLQTRIALVHCVGQPRGSPESFRTWLKPGAGGCEEGSERKKEGCCKRRSKLGATGVFHVALQATNKVFSGTHSGNCYPPSTLAFTISFAVASVVRPPRCWNRLMIAKG